MTDCDESSKGFLERWSRKKIDAEREAPAPAKADAKDASPAAEVGPPDVDQIAGSALHAGGNREQRHDQTDPERDAGGGERSPRAPPQEVLPDQAGPGHVASLTLWSPLATRSGRRSAT